MLPGCGKFRSRVFLSTESPIPVENYPKSHPINHFALKKPLPYWSSGKIIAFSLLLPDAFSEPG
jgi:hypothetical protein